VNCPAGIHITEMMYALKRRGAQEGITPPDSDAIKFANAFTDVVCKFGRAHELGALMRYMAFRHPFRMAGQSGAGIGMMLRGRMPLRAHRIKDREGFARMVEAARQHQEPVR
jgi:heterodisulfide reductase subunit C